MLFLIDFARLDQRIDFAEAIDAEPDVLEYVGLVPNNELGSNDASVRPIQLLDEQSSRSDIERNVVVHQEEEAIVTLDQVQYFVGCCTVPRVIGRLADKGVGQLLVNSFLQIADAAGEQEQRLEIWIVLRGQTAEHLVEFHARIVHDHDGHDGRCEFCVDVHEEPRLAGQHPQVGASPRAREIDECGIADDNAS